VIVAGGLDVTNVAGVIEMTGAWGVDVATGVESAPGVKDRELVVNFVGAAQRHYSQGEERDD
jgi:phosphoribosylanthranilate isomerase